MTVHKVSEKVLSWVPPDEVDWTVVRQAEKVARLDFVRPHLALMPDCHIGRGAIVGSCIPTVGAIIPSAVGGDIGCGIIALNTGLDSNDLPEDLSHLRKKIESLVPVSVGRQNQKYHSHGTTARIKELEDMASERAAFYSELSSNWRMQMGSLGSGNHFIEVVLDDDDNVWAFLHSGSRRVGNRIAQYHINVARRLMKKLHISLEDPDLAYFPEGTPEFDAYIKDLNWAQEYARFNRHEMLDRVLEAIDREVAPSERGKMVECHHNFTQKEHHFGRNMWITRKGAISARQGEEGLIPGSMGTRSYVVRGKGNGPSMHTAPHGAGRLYSRTKAKSMFDMDDFDLHMEGIEVRRSPAFIDELPGAYKDIDTVMGQSSDLVDVLNTLSQVVNVKGE